jgi:glutamate/tyrosine decarboxylase-like PLP-dependent enzyme
MNPNQSGLDHQQLEVLNTQLLHSLEQDGRVFITGTRINQITALRVCIVNHRTQMRHIDRLMSVVTETAEKLLLTS